ncbi:MAG TPA: TetR/AcrR family transcriptional regulator [Myxococcus sp.]|nr:TetR/AcrR family transcriptional regulator [Myxococcus sp.]
MPRAVRLSPRKRPHQARAQATVEDILRAAAHIFTRHGFAAGTTNRIAERAGVSIGSLYQYFPNKDAILVALVEQHVEEGQARVAGALMGAREEGLGLRDSLRRVVKEMVALHLENPALHRVLFEEAPRPPSVRRKLRQTEEQLTEAAAAFFQSWPEVRVSDARAAAWLAVQTVESLTHQYVLHAPEGLPPDTFVDELVALLGGYLTSHRGPG